MNLEPDDDLLIPFALDATDAEVRPAKASQLVSETDGYRCPSCQAVVRLKDGGRRRRHFAHKVSTSTCVLTKAGESDRHLRAKERVAAAVRGDAPAQLRRKCGPCGAQIQWWFPARVAGAAFEQRVTERRVADVALLDSRGVVLGAVEIRASHRVDAFKQEDYARLPWVELDAAEVLAGALWTPLRANLRPIECPACTERKRLAAERAAAERALAAAMPPEPPPPTAPTLGHHSPRSRRPIRAAGASTPKRPLDASENWIWDAFPAPEGLGDEAAAVHFVWLASLDSLIFPGFYRANEFEPYRYVLEFPMDGPVNSTTLPPDVKVVLDVSAMRLATVASASVRIRWELLTHWPAYAWEERIAREFGRLPALPWELAWPDKGSSSFRADVQRRLKLAREKFAEACYKRVREMRSRS